MTIFVNSRYSNQPVIRVTADGITRPTLYRQPASLPLRFLHYVVVEGDRMDNLAYRFFGDAAFWWIIADSNPEVFYPLDLSPGLILRIPQT